MVQTCPKCLTRWKVGADYPQPCPLCHVGKLEDEIKRLRKIIGCVVRTASRLDDSQEEEAARDDD